MNDTVTNGVERRLEVDLSPDHSNNVDEELHRINQALNSVFSSTVPSFQDDKQNWWSQRKLADRYLSSFQHHSIAWMVCDKLLQQTSSPSEDFMTIQQRRFFAAQTLHIKCCSSMHELPVESLPSLRDSLLDHLKRYSNESYSRDKALQNRLAMCTSALAVQMGWITILSDLLGSHNNMYHDIAFSILQTLPEECASERLILLDDSTRYKMRDHLVSSAPNVFSFLLTSIQDGAMSLSLDNVLKVFFIWIRYVPIHPSALVSTSLLGSAIQGLTQQEFMEVAADCVIEVLRMYPSHHYANSELVKLMIPGLAGLPIENALNSGDEDIMRVYCRVVTEMGESYMSLLLSPDYTSYSKLVEWMLMCSEISDPEISSITFHFWYRLAMDLDECDPLDWRQELIDFYAPHLYKLIRVCVITLMKYPSDFDSFDDDRMDDVKRHRMYVTETIEDCCRLLGGQVVIHQIGTLLKESVTRFSSAGSSDWREIESGLACLAALHRFVPSDENEVLPYCFNLVLQLPADKAVLRFTAYQIIGKYAFWLTRRPDVLHPFLPYLSEGLHSSECSPAAAVAINELCKCSNQEFDLADAVFSLYEGLTSGPKRLELEDELQILEGLCRALSRKIQDGRNSGRDFLARLTQPIGNRFATELSNSPTSTKLLIPEIDKLTVVIRNLHLPSVPTEMHPKIYLIQSMWNMLDEATKRFPTDIRLAEKIAGLHKHTLRTCGAAAYAPMLEPLAKQLVCSFEGTRQSPFLYAASICLSEFSRNVAVSQLLYEMIAALSNNVFSFLRTIEELTNHPDVVEEYLYMMSRAVDHSPDHLVRSSLLPSACQFANVAMNMDHHGAQKASLKFFDSIVSYGLKVRDQSEVQLALHTVITQTWQPVVSNVARMLMDELPDHSKQSPDILWKLNALCPSLTSEWLLIALDPSRTSKHVPERAKLELISSLNLGLPLDDFRLVLDAFYSTCANNNRMLSNGSRK